MRCISIEFWLLGGLLCLTGCAGTPNALVTRDQSRPQRPQTAEQSLAGNSLSFGRTEAPRNSRYLAAPKASLADLKPRLRPRKGRELAQADVFRPAKAHVIRTVSHEPKRIQVPAATQAKQDVTLTIGGRTYKAQLVEEVAPDADLQAVRVAAGVSLDVPPVPAFADELAAPTSTHSEISALLPVPDDSLPLTLPKALSMVGGEHPAVGFAQWRVQEAYARLDQAEALWLPSIQAGFSFHKHDGNYQSSNGSIVDVNRNSFQYGLGAGATGTGSSPRPGLVARFHLADALFQPEIAEKTAWAQGHAANGVVNEQLLKVALAYQELLRAEWDAQTVEDTRDRTAKLSKLTEDFADSGQGSQADADRLQTEFQLVEGRLVSAHERIQVASARLSETLSIDAGRRIVLEGLMVIEDFMEDVRLELVSSDLDKSTLIATGLANRPELKESQALVVAACEQQKRQEYAPFVPSLALGFSSGGFGGGQGNSLNDVQGRYDWDALVTWEIRNLGFGERSARRETESRVQQANFETVRVMDQVAREVVEAHAQVVHRSQRISITEKAIQSAENSYEQNLNRIRNGEGIPLEVLQSVRALEEARRAYLNALVDYNAAQIHLQWALGWPVSAPGDDTAALMEPQP